MKPPVIRAKLVLDEKDTPSAVEDERPHYRIKLWVDEVPPDTYSVTYFLDESYYERVREVRNPPFELEITSFGDFPVQATISAPSGTMTASVPLSWALKLSHQQPSRVVEDALLNIARN